MGLWVLWALLLGSTARAGDFTFDSFAQAIRDKQLGSVEAALAEVPAEYWRHYVLLHDSHSTQSASPAFPRAVLHGDDAHLVIAFSGDPKLTGYNTLEMIQYRDDQRRYEFREIQFSAGKPARISDANPRECRSCHQESLRPNWADYPTWAGTYGSSDDTLAGDERAHYLDFVKRAPELERYRRLQRGSAREIAPYSDERFGKFDERPNLYFTKLLTRRHARALAHQMLTRGHSPLAVGMAALGCTDVGENGVAHLAGMLHEGTVAVQSFLRSGTSGDLLERILAAEQIGPSDWDMTFVETPADWKDVSLAGSFYDGYFQLVELVRYAVASELGETYPEVRAVLRERPYYSDPKNLTPSVQTMVQIVNVLGGALDNQEDQLCPLLLKHAGD